MLAAQIFAIKPYWNDRSRLGTDMLKQAKHLFVGATVILAASCAAEIIPEDSWTEMQHEFESMQGQKALAINITQDGDNFSYSYYVAFAKTSDKEACLEALKKCVSDSEERERQVGGCRIVAVNDTWNAKRSDFSYDDHKGDALAAAFLTGLAQGGQQYGANPLRVEQVKLESAQAAGNYDSRSPFDPALQPPACH